METSKDPSIFSVVFFSILPVSLLICAAGGGRFRFQETTGESSSITPMARRKNPGGRKKIEIKRITTEQARQVCFSKRRMGLFKKACELCILCGAEVAIVVYSPAGRPFSLGGPDVGMVADRFLSGPAGQGQPPLSYPTHYLPAHLCAARWRVREDPSDLQRALAAEKRSRAALEQALGAARGASAAADVKDMRLHELEEMETALLGLRAEVAVWTREMLFEVDVDGCWNGAAPADAVVAGGYPDTVGVGDGAGNRALRLVLRYPVVQRSA